MTKSKAKNTETTTAPEVAAVTATKPAVDLEELEIRWLELFGYHCSNTPRGDMNKAEILALQRFASKAGKHAMAILEAAVENWTDLASVIKRESNEEYRVTFPTVFALVMHYKIVRNWVQLRGFITGQPVQQKDHIRIGVPAAAQPYQSMTVKGIA